MEKSKRLKIGDGLISGYIAIFLGVIGSDLITIFFRCNVRKSKYIIFNSEQ